MAIPNDMAMVAVCLLVTGSVLGALVFPASVSASGLPSDGVQRSLFAAGVVCDSRGAADYMHIEMIPQDIAVSFGSNMITVPEPATIFIMGIGAGLIVLGIRNKKY
jgi:hypothetical protein